MKRGRKFYLDLYPWNPRSQAVPVSARCYWLRYPPHNPELRILPLYAFEEDTPELVSFDVYSGVILAPAGSTRSPCGT